MLVRSVVNAARMEAAHCLISEPSLSGARVVGGAAVTWRCRASECKSYETSCPPAWHLCPLSSPWRHGAEARRAGDVPGRKATGQWVQRASRTTSQDRRLRREVSVCGANTSMKQHKTYVSRCKYICQKEKNTFLVLVWPFFDLTLMCEQHNAGVSLLFLEILKAQCVRLSGI